MINSHRTADRSSEAVHHRPRNSPHPADPPLLPGAKIAALEIHGPSFPGSVVRSEDPTHGMTAEVEAELCAEKLLKADGPHLPGMLRRLSSWSTLTRWRRSWKRCSSSAASHFGAFSALMGDLSGSPGTAAVCNTSTPYIPVS